MAHSAHIREKARTLRIQRQLTIDQLAERLALPRTTIYYWVRDLPIPGSGPGGGWTKGAREQGSDAMQSKYSLLREQTYGRGKAEFDELALDRTFRDFICLYIAEGSKRKRNEVELCNSDPAVMQVVTRWLRALASKPCGFRIQYHVDQDLDELRGFWGALLEIDPESIKLQRKSNSNGLAGRNWRSRHGVLTVRVCDTLLRARMQAWMDRLRREWAVDSQHPGA